MFQNMIRGSDLQAEVTKYLAGRAGGWRVDLESGPGEAEKSFSKGDYVLAYVGELVDL